MRSHLMSALLLLFLAAPALAVNDARPRDSVNFELMGKGIAFSLNGEVGLVDRFALGAGFVPLRGNKDGYTFIFPMHLSWVSHRTWGLYLAAGATYVHNTEATDNESELHATLTGGGQASIGDRMYLRLAITHFDRIDHNEEKNPWDWDLFESILWPGITVGVRF